MINNVYTLEIHMTDFTCKYCKSERINKNSLRNHERLCNHNPLKTTQLLDKARQAAAEKVSCIWCDNLYSKSNIQKHQNSCNKNPIVIQEKTKICPVCNKTYLGETTTCSYSCSNTYFRHKNEGGLQYAEDEVLVESGRYRDLCFRYHTKKCIICSEENIVSVHHINENHDDNRPENLVPLCPTHHQYCHSRYRHLVETKIEEYIQTWKITNLSVG